VGAVHDELLVARRVGEMAMVNVASPAYLAAHGTPEHPDDLLAQGHQLVHYTQAWSDRRARFEWLEGGQPRGVALPARVAVNQTEAYEAAALIGAGIAQCPWVGVRPALQAGRLVRVLPGYEPAPLPVHLVQSQRRHTPRRVQVFMDWLAQLLAGHLVAPGA
jgi:DNA-binding transcriptional LysR family regulator